MATETTQDNLNKINGVNLVRSLGIVNPVAEIFDSSQKKSDFPEIFPDFPGKNLTTFFSLQLKKLSFLPKY